ncbi:MAG: hypothetical protein JSV11_00385 [Nitrospiraceae bacterium]|jgi:hypothetical protein|nr:MAG: hypothetical protein JSV11_00385 [Nitrospiraceae bacterium]
MIIKKIIHPDRVRHVNGGFSFIPHRFLTDGFLTSLSRQEVLLYFFLILASDRNGLSYYSYDSICKFLQLNLDEYLKARDGLLIKDLIAFDSTIFQVLDLPLKPISPDPCRSPSAQRSSTIAHLIQKSLKEA